MSLFAKTGPLLAASLMIVGSAFGQSKCPPKSFDQGHELVQSQMMPAYNAPARIDVRGSWDLYAQGSFTYWQPIQENMELGLVSDVAGGNTMLNGNIVNLDFDYKPGFKTGLGINFEHGDWDTFAEYTWFRGKHTTATKLDRANSPDATIHPIALFPVNSSYYNASQSWRLHMDLLDWQLARSYYVGMKLSFRPFFAARAAWIRQNAKLNFEDNKETANAYASQQNKKSRSWGVGPRVGIGTNWMLGEGFRLFGNGGADVLFTQYTKLRSSQVNLDQQGQQVEDERFVVIQTKYNTLRTHLDLELGFGWGTYFDNNNWHVDLSAGYGFQVFFDQNMFRTFNNSTMSTGLAVSNNPSGNLYVHGLTATLRFDF